MSVQSVIERRRRERQELLDRARPFTERLDRARGIVAVVVFGSVARGDFNLWSDVDVLVVAERLPDSGLERLRVLGSRPPRVQPLGWTPAEWARRLAKHDPIAREALDAGVWLVGSPEALAPSRS